MRHIIIKEGEHRPNAFADLVETVNWDGINPDIEQVGFYTRIDYTFRLMRNRSTMNPEMPLAVAHYHVDPNSPIQQHGLFRPINVELMTTALDTYDYVLFGIVSKQHMVQDYTLLDQATYIARTAEGKLIDITTNQLINPNAGDLTLITSFFGMVRMKGLPIYQMILDSKLLRVTDSFDYYNAGDDTMYTLVTDNDGTACDKVFDVVISGGEVFGNTILTTGEQVTFTFFQGARSILRNSPLDLNGLDNLTVTSPAKITMDANRIHVSVEDRFIPITMAFDCGLFYTLSHQLERPIFKYLIIKA